jgi:hypothetical protein
MVKSYKQRIQDARATPFDNSVLNLPGNPQDTQTALELIYQGAAPIASPGFTWGRSGTTRNTYLSNDTVPSNLSGRVVTLQGNITSIFVANQNAGDKFQVQIQKRVGNTFTTVATLLADGTSRIYSGTVLAAVGIGDELCCYIQGSGTISGVSLTGATNPVCGIIIQGV